MGNNATHGLADVLTRFTTHEPKRIEVSGLEYRKGLNTARIGGGMTDNIVLPEVWVEINYRLAPDKSLDEALRCLEGAPDGYAFEVTDLSSVTRPGLDRPLAWEFVSAIDGEALPKYGRADVPRFSALEIPAVSYGPGNSPLARRDDECCPTKHLRICADDFRRRLV